MKRRLIALASAVIMGFAARGESIPALPPGEYEVSVTVELPHVDETGASKVATICVPEANDHATWGLVVLSDNNPLARCPALNAHRDGNTLTFDLICPGRNQAIGSAKYALAAQGFAGVIVMKMGGKNMTIIERQTGRRIGSCKPALEPVPQ